MHRREKKKPSNKWLLVARLMICSEVDLPRSLHDTTHHHHPEIFNFLLAGLSSSPLSYNQGAHVKTQRYHPAEEKSSVNRQRGFPSLFLTRISSKEPASRKEEGNKQQHLDGNPGDMFHSFIHSFGHMVRTPNSAGRLTLSNEEEPQQGNNTQTQTQNTKGERTTNAAALDPGTRVEVAHW